MRQKRNANRRQLANPPIFHRQLQPARNPLQRPSLSLAPPPKPLDWRRSRPLGQSLCRRKRPPPFHKPSPTRLEAFETLFPNRRRPWQNHPAIPSRSAFAKRHRPLPRASAFAAKPLGNARFLHPLLQQTNPAHRADYRSTRPMLSTADHRPRRRALRLAIPATRSHCRHY